MCNDAAHVCKHATEHIRISFQVGFKITMFHVWKRPCDVWMWIYIHFIQLTFQYNFNHADFYNYSYTRRHQAIT